MGAVPQDRLAKDLLKRLETNVQKPTVKPDAETPPAEQPEPDTPAREI